jgi:hypothetical protein
LLENAAVGPERIVTGAQYVPVQPPEVVTVKDTFIGLVVPGAKMCVGFCKLEVVPSPKFQFQLVMVPPLAFDTSVKCVGCPAHCVVFVKEAVTTGGGGPIVVSEIKLQVIPLLPSVPILTV